jgi:branched-subunit amino acid aminotransferase/4-amino-4-deoxychorismate lyase
MITPAEDMLKGISRKQVILLAEQLGIPVEERELSLEEVYQASEAFITASTRRITPIAQVDDKVLPGIGPRTRQLWGAFLQHEKAYIQVERP